MNRRNIFLFFLLSLTITITILVITLVKDRTSVIGYTIFAICLLPTSVLLSLFIRNDSITKYRKIELENYIKNHPELNVITYDIKHNNCYIEMANSDSLIFVSIFRKHAYLDVFSKEESKKLRYLESLEDESLKKEGFLNLMKDKKGITLYINKLSAEDIFIKVKANI